MAEFKENEALQAEYIHRSVVENSTDYIENFDILETITNVGNDEVFTPRKICDEMLDALPEEVWHNPNYKWLNPCSKNGIFEREIAIRLDKGLKDIIPETEKRRKHVLQNMIFSIGLTKFTSHVARRTLYYCNDASRKCDGLKADDGHYINGYSIGNGSWFNTSDGNILTPRSDHKFGKDNRCIYCGIRSDSKYVDPNQREQYAYEFIHNNKNFLLEQHLQKKFFNGDKNMKFDIIIGNPPYQLSFGIQGTNSANSLSIYNNFISNAISLNPKYVSMITPSRWMTKTAQGIPEEWVDKMIKDNRFVSIDDYQYGGDVFSTVEIKGGVSFFLWDRDYNGKCTYTYHYTNNKEKITRIDYLDSKNAGVVIRDPKSFAIIDRISKVEGFYYEKEDENFSGLVSPKHFFDNGGLLTSNWKDYKLEQSKEYNIKYYVSQQSNGVPFGWISEKQLPTNKHTLQLHKVFIPAAGGSGTDKKILGTPFYGEPMSVCSQTYLVIGYDPKHNLDENKCKNIIKYIQTRFFRYLVSVKKKTQNGPRGVYQFVPLQDFSKPWTDKELYAKYKLSDEEIRVIEDNIEEI